MIKRCFLFSIMLLAMWRTDSDANAHHLVILSDRTGNADQKMFEQIINEAERLKPDAWINVGDLIEGPQPDENAIQKEWDIVMGTLTHVTAPFYYIPGNNDIFSDESRRIFTERTHCTPYYSFDIGNAHILVLDTSQIETYEEMPENQKQWMESDLASCPDTRLKLIFTHKPLWFDTQSKGQTDPFHEICARYKVRFVFSGHFHQYIHHEKDGVIYIVLGPSAAVCEDRVDTGRFYQFGWLTIDDNDISFAIIDSPSVLPENHISLERAIAQDRFESDFVCFNVDQDNNNLKLQKGIIKFTDFGYKQAQCSFSWDVIGTHWKVIPGNGSVIVSDGKGANVNYEAELMGKLVYPLPLMTTEITLEGQAPYRTVSLLEIKRATRAPRINKRIHFDGILDEKIWEKAGICSEFGSLDGKISEIDPTEVRIAFGKTHLILGITASDANVDALNIPAIDRDGGVFQHDYVLITLMPDTLSEDLYRIFVNVNGDILDMKSLPVESESKKRKFDPAWNGDYDMAVSRSADAWIIEMGIPYQDIGIDVPGRTGRQNRSNTSYIDRMAINFIRYCEKYDKLSAWQIPIGNKKSDFGAVDVK